MMEAVVHKPTNHPANYVIFFQSLSQAPYGRYINFDKQHDHGWELEGKSQIGKLSIWGNLTLLEGAITTKVSGKDTTYNNLYRRPKGLANLGLRVQRASTAMQGHDATARDRHTSISPLQSSHKALPIHITET